MRMKRFAMLAAVLATALMVSAVGGAQIQLTYWGMTSGSEQQERAVIEEFNRLYAGRIHVDPGHVMSTGDLREKLVVALAADVAPDVVRFDRFAIPEWAYQGLFKPLDQLIERDAFDRDDFYPAAWDELIFQGKTYGIPHNIDVRAFLYNQDVYSQSGLDPDVAPRTWDDLASFSRKVEVRDANGQFQRIGYNPVNAWHFNGYLLMTGGELIDATQRQVTWNSPAGYQAATYFADWIAYYGGYNEIRRVRTGGVYPSFADGRVASVIGASGYIGSILAVGPDTEIGVGPVPRPTELADEIVSWSGGFALVIPTTTPSSKDDAAWEFIKFFTSAESMAKQFQGSKLGSLPPRRTAMSNPEFQASQPHQLLDFLAILPYSTFRPVIPGGETLYNIYRQTFEDMIVTGMPPEQVVNETARLGQLALDEVWRVKQ